MFFFAHSLSEIDLAQLVEVDFELVGPIGQRGGVVCDARVGLLSEPDEILARAVEAVLQDVELQA